MNHADQTALWDVCLTQWGRLMVRWTKVRLPTEDWNDIRSEAFIRVFQKADHYDPDKGAPEIWVRTVIQRSIINSLRAIIPSLPEHEWRTSILCARPILTRVEQTGQWGEQVTIVEPDMVDESLIHPDAQLRWEEFIARLRFDQRIILTQRGRGWSLMAIKRKWFKDKTYSKVNSRLLDIKRQWKEYCR